ncbi:DUF2812 domain-containing protein [Peptoniphilus sp.]|jgi:hypothetical protein|uniref:DUF2812 domain-containing protein n=1 Tax=Peptoniphilus sp. TaxID=1971214 RepID=UPI003D8EA43A
MAEKTEYKIFTIADFEEEEKWLESEHKKGWELEKITAGFIYKFKKVAPNNIVYRLDFGENKASDDYFQLYRDYGWEHFYSFMGWHYFRKEVQEDADKNEVEIFSDKESKIDMIDKIYITRMMPIFIIFCLAIIPNLFDFNGEFNASKVFYLLAFILYLYIIVHCGAKLTKLKKELEK